jgi:hypothetical protein
LAQFHENLIVRPYFDPSNKYELGLYCVQAPDLSLETPN